MVLQRTACGACGSDYGEEKLLGDSNGKNELWSGLLKADASPLEPKASDRTRDMHSDVKHALLNILPEHMQTGHSPAVQGQRG